jgi:hypothetical protein
MVPGSCSVESGEIVCANSDDEIFTRVDSGEVLVLKSLFDRPLLDALRAAVFDWSKTIEPCVAPGTNHHNVLWGISQRQKTSHAYHAYNFNFDHLSGESTLMDLLRRVFLPMRAFHLRLTGNPPGFPPIHPQIIQYPLGGGHLADHVHPYDPQRLGFVLNLSQKGEHFQAGEGTFDQGEALVFGTSDIGDMAIFRFDKVHGVTPVDAGPGATSWDPDCGAWMTDEGSPAGQVQWNRPEGRWVAVLSVQY